jgi:hypothetical protein
MSSNKTSKMSEDETLWIDKKEDMINAWKPIIYTDSKIKKPNKEVLEMILLSYTHRFQDEPCLDCEEESEGTDESDEENVEIINDCGIPRCSRHYDRDEDLYEVKQERLDQISAHKLFVTRIQGWLAEENRLEKSKRKDNSPLLEKYKKLRECNEEE